MKKAVDIFEHRGCISEDMLTKYATSQLSPAEKHAVEKHLVDCELCSDALEGLKMIGDPKRLSTVTGELNRKISERSAKRETKIIFLRRYRTQLAVAASVAVILGLVWFFRSAAPVKEMDAVSAEKMFADKFELPPAETAPPPAPVEEPGAEEKNADRLSGTSSESKQIVSLKKERNTVVQEEAAGVADADAPAPSKQEMHAYTQEGAKTPADQFAKAPAAKKANEPEMGRKEDEKNAVPPAAQVTSGAGTAVQGNNTSGPVIYKWETSNQAAAPAASEAGTYTVTTSSATGTKSKAEQKRSKQKSAAYGDFESARAPANADSRAEKTFADSTAHYSSAKDSLARKEYQEKESGMSKYGKQDYAGAVAAFEEALKKDPNDEQALFYAGVSWLSLEQPDKAIAHLTRITQNRSSKYFDDSQWYLSLAYIKKKDAQNARTILTELRNNSGSKYRKQAEETLKEIGK